MRYVIVYDDKEVVLSKNISDTAIVYHDPKYKVIMRKIDKPIVEDEEDKIESVKIFLEEKNIIVSKDATLDISKLLDPFLTDFNYIKEIDEKVIINK
jgi:hypothetical protein